MPDEVVLLKEDRLLFVGFEALLAPLAKSPRVRLANHMANREAVARFVSYQRNAPQETGEKSRESGRTVTSLEAQFHRSPDSALAIRI